MHLHRGIKLLVDNMFFGVQLVDLQWVAIVGELRKKNPIIYMNQCL
jgi:hypothetical protein